VISCWITAGGASLSGRALSHSLRSQALTSTTPSLAYRPRIFVIAVCPAFEIDIAGQPDGGCQPAVPFGALGIRGDVGRQGTTRRDCTFPGYARLDEAFPRLHVIHAADRLDELERLRNL
jgi:hypothetical protein